MNYVTRGTTSKQTWFQTGRNNTPFMSLSANFRGLTISTGNKLKIELSKPSSLFPEGVVFVGKVVFDQAAFCIKLETGQLITLRNINDKAKIQIIHEEPPKNQLDIFQK